MSNTNADRNAKLFSALQGRTISDFGVDYEEQKLCIFFTDGIVFSLWVDGEGCLCLDVDRRTRQ